MVLSKQDEKRAAGMKILASIFLIAAVVASVYATGYCQDNSRGRAIKTLEGEVTQIDTVGNTFVIRWMGWDDGIGYREAAFSVSPATKIIKGTDAISFMDVNQFDRVVINYIDDHSTAPMATSIIVDNNF